MLVYSPLERFDVSFPFCFGLELARGRKNIIDVECSRFVLALITELVAFFVLLGGSEVLGEVHKHLRDDLEFVYVYLAFCNLLFFKKDKKACSSL